MPNDRRISRSLGLALLCFVLAGAAVIGFLEIARRGQAASGPSIAKGLHVSGNRLLDGQGRPVEFQGVDRSGTEYACIQGWGIFDGPSDPRSVHAIASWRVNLVRIPLNEDCWLGINGAKRKYSGARYRTAIVNYVRLLHRYGIYAELSLIWAAPGAYPATYQSGGPDADHSLTVWSELARTFMHDPNVILAPWGETVVDAKCFLRGGVCEATFGPQNIPYRVAGMQQAVNVMRAAGYEGVISIPGIDYANDLSQWLTHEPRDPRRQLIAEAHVYGKNVCGTVQCFQTTLRPVAQRVPLLLAEVGESYDGSDCGTSHISTIVNWADSHHVSYAAWTWDTWGNCGALINDYAGSPRGPYGAWIKAHYARRSGLVLLGQ
jgi:Cellulase (glycosyl hydrolase family 5)